MKTSKANTTTTTTTTNEAPVDLSALRDAASAAIKEAAAEAVTTIVAAKGKLTLVIREHVEILRTAGEGERAIASLVREAIGDAASPSHISRTLTSVGIRLRGKRSDAGHLKLADHVLGLVAQPAAPRKPADEPPTGGDDGEGGDGEGGEGEGEGGEGGGHTAETLAALLQSLDPDLVRKALIIAGLA